jgi:hypothetical protein
MAMPPTRERPPALSRRTLPRAWRSVRRLRHPSRPSPDVERHDRGRLRGVSRRRRTVSRRVGTASVTSQEGSLADSISTRKEERDNRSSVLGLR